MPSYLDDTYLGDLDDDDYEVGSADSLPAVDNAPMTPPNAVTVPMVRLPGGITMPRSTAYLLAIMVAVAVYLIWKRLNAAKHKD